MVRATGILHSKCENSITSARLIKDCKSETRVVVTVVKKRSKRFAAEDTCGLSQRVSLLSLACSIIIIIIVRVQASWGGVVCRNFLPLYFMNALGNGGGRIGATDNYFIGNYKSNTRAPGALTPRVHCDDRPRRSRCPPPRGSVTASAVFFQGRFIIIFFFFVFIFCTSNFSWSFYLFSFHQDNNRTYTILNNSFFLDNVFHCFFFKPEVLNCRT